MSPSFLENHRYSVLLNAIFGYCVPGDPHSARKFLYYYSRAIVVLFFLHSLLMLGGLRNKGNAEASFGTVAMLILSYNYLPVAIYCLVKEKEFTSLIDSFDKIADHFHNEPISSLTFGLRMETNFRRIKLFSWVTVLTIQLQVVYLSVDYFGHYLGWLGLEIKAKILYEMLLPYNRNVSPYFELTTFVQFLATDFVLMQDIILYIFSVLLFNTVWTYLQQIREDFEGVFAQHDKNIAMSMATDLGTARGVKERSAKQYHLPIFQHTQGSSITSARLDLSTQVITIGSSRRNALTNDQHNIEAVADPASGVIFTTASEATSQCSTTHDRLRNWVQIHQAAMLAGEQLCLLYTFIYSVLLLRTICLHAVEVTLATDKNTSLGLAGTILAFVFVSLAKHLLLCLAGHTMIQESLGFADIVFWKTSLPLTKSIKKSLMIIMMRTQKPLQAVAYDHTAKVDLRTFVRICDLSISFFLTLKAIKAK